MRVWCKKERKTNKNTTYFPLISFHTIWQARPVKITKGPFMGGEGQTCGTYNPNVKVALPEIDKIEKLWFNCSNLERV